MVETRLPVRQCYATQGLSAEFRSRFDRAMALVPRVSRGNLARVAAKYRMAYKSWRGGTGIEVHLKPNAIELTAALRQEGVTDEDVLDFALNGWGMSVAERIGGML